MQIDRYLLRCCAQINPQRIIDTPAVNLCSRLVSILSICKKANGERLFRTDKDVGGSIQKRVCLQTRSPRMYTDVHSWARHLRRCCAKINAQRTKSTSPLYFCSRLVVSERTRMSGVLISSDVFAAQKLASGSVHGCTLPDRLFAKKLMVKGFSEPTRTSVVPYRSEFACKLVAHECTRMYTFGQAIYKKANGKRPSERPRKKKLPRPLRAQRIVRDYLTVILSRILCALCG